MKIFKNFQIKILAAISALLLWLFVVGVENYVFVFPTDLPVKIINLGQNVSVANELSKVKVRYKATDNSGKNINSNEFDLFLDAQNLNEGNYSLTVNYISKNPKVSIVSIEPARLELNLEGITSKELKIKTDVVGSTAKGFDLKNVKLSQETIKVSGAASLLGKLSILPIKISLDGSENADFSRKITPEAPAEWNLSGKTISFDPPVIQANIEIRKTAKTETVVDDNLSTIPTNSGDIQLKKKTLMAEIVKDIELRSSVRELLPENILVTVEGEESEIAKLTNDSIKLNLSSAKISKDGYTVDLKDIELPFGVKVKVLEFSPSKVLVKF